MREEGKEGGRKGERAGKTDIHSHRLLFPTPSNKLGL